MTPPASATQSNSNDPIAMALARYNAAGAKANRVVGQFKAQAEAGNLEAKKQIDAAEAARVLAQQEYRAALGLARVTGGRDPHATKVQVAAQTPTPKKLPASSSIAKIEQVAEPRKAAYISFMVEQLPKAYYEQAQFVRAYESIRRPFAAKHLEHLEHVAELVRGLIGDKSSKFDGDRLQSLRAGIELFHSNHEAM